MRGIPESCVVAEEKEEDTGEVDRGAHDALVFFVWIGGSVIAYFLVDVEDQVWVPFTNEMSLSNLVLGLGLAFSLLGIGLGAVHWAKTLMSDEEVVEERHPLARAHPLQRRTQRVPAGGVVLQSGVDAQLDHTGIGDVSGGEDPDAQRPGRGMMGT